MHIHVPHISNTCTTKKVIVMGLLGIDLYIIRIFEYIRISYANIRIPISAFVDIPNKKQLGVIFAVSQRDANGIILHCLKYFDEILDL